MTWRSRLVILACLANAAFVRAQDAMPPTAPPSAQEEGDDGGRIVGGTRAPEGTVPWQVEIFYSGTYSEDDVARDRSLRANDPAKQFLSLKQPWEREHRCGGVLIEEGWVLTAAHCITKTPGDFLTARKVRIGTQNLSTGGAIYRIERAARHIKYNGNRKTNDVALLHIVPDGRADPAALAQAKPIRLLGSDPRDRKLTDLDDVIVTGWGLTLAANDEPGQLAADRQTVNRASPRLMQVDLKVLPTERCTVVNDYKGRLDATTICSGSLEGTKDSCSGDSGGPMTRAQGRERVLVGLVSWGTGCALPGIPAIYTRVSVFRQWIAKAKQAPPGKVTPM